jgi:hypothetical protein
MLESIRPSKQMYIIANKLYKVNMLTVLTGVTERRILRIHQ